MKSMWKKDGGVVVLQLMGARGLERTFVLVPIGGGAQHVTPALA